MSKKWVLIIFGITALVMFVKPTQAVNLLTNPNFETWSSLYQPTGWTVGTCSMPSGRSTPA